MKCISVSVLRNRGQGCSNGGGSDKYWDIYIPHPEGFLDVDEDNPQLYKVVHRQLFGQDVVHLEPWKPAEHIGWMASGNFAHASDSRFSELIGFYGAVAIHDRQETQKEYDTLSH